MVPHVSFNTREAPESVQRWLQAGLFSFLLNSMSPYKSLQLLVYVLTEDDWYNRLYLLMNLISSAGRIRGRLLLIQKLEDLKISLSLWRSLFRFVSYAYVNSIFKHMFVHTADHWNYKYLKGCRVLVFRGLSRNMFT